jgi:hypothetical protein
VVLPGFINWKKIRTGLHDDKSWYFTTGTTWFYRWYHLVLPAIYSHCIISGLQANGSFSGIPMNHIQLGYPPVSQHIYGKVVPFVDLQGKAMDFKIVFCIFAGG